MVIKFDVERDSWTWNHKSRRNIIADTQVYICSLPPLLPPQKITDDQKSSKAPPCPSLCACVLYICVSLEVLGSNTFKSSNEIWDTIHHMSPILAELVMQICALVAKDGQVCLNGHINQQLTSLLACHCHIFIHPPLFSMSLEQACWVGNDTSTRPEDTNKRKYDSKEHPRDERQRRGGTEGTSQAGGL